MCQTLSKYKGEYKYRNTICPLGNIIIIKVTGAKVLSRIVGEDFGYSKLEITLDQSVLITKSLYPPLSVSKLFSDFGGAMGLWLGLGAIQLFGYGVNAAIFIKFLNKKNSNT